MKVLGISPLDRDATVSIVEDGEILFAAGEERFSRVKQQTGFPRLAIQEALAFTGTRIEEIDKVAYPFLDWQNEEKLFKKNVALEKEFVDTFNRPDIHASVKACLLYTSPSPRDS